MAISKQRALTSDMKQFISDDKVRRNILSVRTSTSKEDGYVDQGSFIVKAGKSINVPDLPQCLAATVYCDKPVYVTGLVDGNLTSTNFPAQTLLSMTVGLNNIVVSNPNTEDVSVTVIRLSQSEADYMIARHLVTFTPLSRIAPIGSAVTILANVQVEDVALFPLTNNQVIAPSNLAGQTFRICDSLGVASPTGDHIMYLNDVVTQQNFSGTLQLWVAEVN